MSHSIHIWVLFTFLLLASWADALSSCGSTTGRLQVTQDCVLRPLTATANSSNVMVSGSLGTKGLPGLYAEQGTAAAAAAAAEHTGGVHVVLQQLVLVNFTLAAPTAAAAAAHEREPSAAPATACGAPLLWPLELLPLPGCNSNPGTSSSSSSGWRLSMTDVRILVPPQQLAAVLPAFQGLPSVYTDNVTFLHIIGYDSYTTHLASVTLLTPATLAPGSLAALDTSSLAGLSDNSTSSSGNDTRSSSSTSSSRESSSSSAASVHLSVDNTTLVSLLVAEGGTPTPAPLLLFLTANVTLGAPPPALAATGGFHVARPVYLVGLASTPTSLDFHQAVNQVNLTGQSIDQVHTTDQVNATGLADNWARLYMFDLALENLGYGDVTSARGAGPFPTLVVGNLWAMVFNRTGPLRVVQHNCTVVVPPVEIDYLTWSTTLFSNPLPYSQQQTSFLQNQLFMAIKVIQGPTPGSLLMVQAKSGARADYNTTITSTPVVAPALPRLAPPAGALAADVPAPTVSVADSGMAVEARLLKQTNSSKRQDIFLVTHHLQLLAAGCDPAMATNSTNNTSPSSSSSSSSSTAAAAAATSSSNPAGNSTQPPAAPAATHPLSFEVQQPTMFAGVAPGAGLSWGYAPGVLLLPPGSQKEGYLALQRLRLTQLPQGPPPGQKGGTQDIGGVSPGLRLASGRRACRRKLLLLEHPGRQLAAQGVAESPPEAWTLLLWGVGRPVDTPIAHVSLTDVELLLPPKEHAFLQQQATEAPAFLVPLKGLSQGLSLQGVTASPSGALQVAAFRGPGVVGTNLTLLPDTTPPPPGAHPWPFPAPPPPAAPAAAGPGSGLRGVQLVVVGAMVPACVVLLAVGVAACVYVGRRRRTQQQQEQQQQQKGLSCCRLSKACGSMGSSDSKGGGHECTIRTPSPPQAAAAGSGIFVSDTRTWDQDSTTASLGVVHVVPVAGLGRRPDAVLPRLKSARDRDASEFGLPKGSPAAGPGGPQASLVLSRWQAALAAASGQILGRRLGRSWGDADQILGDTGGMSQAAGGAQCSPEAAAAAAAVATGGDTPLSRQGGSGAFSAAGAAICAATPPPAAPGVGAPLAAAGGLAAHHHHQQQQQPAAAGVGHAAGGGSGSTTQSSAAGGVPGLLLERQLGEGSFGTVFAGTWRGKQVAVKVVQYRPAALQQQLGNTLAHRPRSRATTSSTSSSSDGSGSGRGREGARGGGGGAAGARRHEAVVEAAVAAHVCHPNIVQVYTYSLTPVLTIPFAHHGGTSSSTQGSQGGDGAASSSQPPSAAAAANGCGAQPPHQQQQQGGGSITSWELHLVMEYCDQGSLREALDRRLLCRPTSTTTAGAASAAGAAAAAPGGSSRTSSHTTAPHLPLVLHLAHDIAAALVHLHAEGIAHGDIKAANVLLTSGGVVGEARRADWAVAAAAAAGGGGGGGSRVAEAWKGAAAPGGGGGVSSSSSSSRRVGMALTAKLTDFGLAVLNLEGTNHITYGMRGTPAYMSPELLLRGRVSKASDVYALGVLLWECVTGGVALRGVPLALLPHQVAQEGLRPTWPAHLASNPQVGPLRQLVEACWAGKPRDRPTAEQVMHQLEHIQAALHQQQQQQQQQQHEPWDAAPAPIAAPSAKAGTGMCVSSSSGGGAGVEVLCGASGTTQAAAAAPRAALQVAGAVQGSTSQGVVPQGVMGPVTASWTMG